MDSTSVVHMYINKEIGWHFKYNLWYKISGCQACAPGAYHWSLCICTIKSTGELNGTSTRWKVTRSQNKMEIGNKRSLQSIKFKYISCFIVKN